jgi:hypothetical protein
MVGILGAMEARSLPVGHDLCLQRSAYQSVMAIPGIRRGDDLRAQNMETNCLMSESHIDPASAG